MNKNENNMKDVEETKYQFEVVYRVLVFVSLLMIPISYLWNRVGFMMSCNHRLFVQIFVPKVGIGFD